MLRAFPGSNEPRQGYRAADGREGRRLVSFRTSQADHCESHITPQCTGPGLALLAPAGDCAL